MANFNHLKLLEAEAIHIMREVAASFDKPCMFYSIGKDSTVMLHLARKAFYPDKVPFTLLHVDTTWEFHEMGAFRDNLRDKLGLDIIVHINQEALDMGIHPIESGSVKYNDHMKTIALKQALDEHKFDAALGNLFVFSLCQTGLSLIFGYISYKKKSTLCLYTSRMSA